MTNVPPPPHTHVCDPIFAVKELYWYSVGRYSRAVTVSVITIPREYCTRTHTTVWLWVEPKAAHANPLLQENLRRQQLARHERYAKIARKCAWQIHVSGWY